MSNTGSPHNITNSDLKRYATLFFNKVSHKSDNPKLDYFETSNLIHTNVKGSLCNAVVLRDPSSNQRLLTIPLSSSTNSAGTKDTGVSVMMRITHRQYLYYMLTIESVLREMPATISDNVPLTLVHVIREFANLKRTELGRLTYKSSLPGLEDYHLQVVHTFVTWLHNEYTRSVKNKAEQKYEYLIRDTLVSSTKYNSNLSLNGPLKIADIQGTVRSTCTLVAYGRPPMPSVSSEEVFKEFIPVMQEDQYLSQEGGSHRMYYENNKSEHTALVDSALNHHKTTIEDAYDNIQLVETSDGRIALWATTGSAVYSKGVALRKVAFKSTAIQKGSMSSLGASSSNDVRMANPCSYAGIRAIHSQPIKPSSALVASGAYYNHIETVNVVLRTCLFQSKLALNNLVNRLTLEEFSDYLKMIFLKSLMEYPKALCTHYLPISLDDIINTTPLRDDEYVMQSNNQSFVNSNLPGIHRVDITLEAVEAMFDSKVKYDHRFFALSPKEIVFGLVDKYVKTIQEGLKEHFNE